MWIAIIGALVLLATGIGTWRVLASQSTTPPSQGSSVDGQQWWYREEWRFDERPVARAGSTSPDRTGSPISDSVTCHRREPASTTFQTRCCRAVLLMARRRLVRVI